MLSAVLVRQVSVAVVLSHLWIIPLVGRGISSKQLLTILVLVLDGTSAASLKL